MIMKVSFLLLTSLPFLTAQSPCVPQDACSVAVVNSQGECVQEFKDCNDNDINTIDGCSYQHGCMHIQADASMDFDLVFGDVDIFYEDPLDIDSDEVLAILDWIKNEVTQVRTPFCWKQSYGRGAGYALSDCPAGKQRIGALCYTPCPSGYSRQGTFDCQQECKPGWRDDGLFCRLPEYGRGAGYPWQFGDPLSDAGQRSRCERDHGRGNCEPWGLFWYPKCRSGFAPAGCCICRPRTPDCVREGYAGGFDLSCAVKIQLGDPTPLICASHLEQGGGLCYPRCQNGFNGVGPVCWQQCDTDQVDCGAGCASSSEDCAFAVVDQVLAPIIVLVNIATFGLADAAGDAVDAVQVGNKLVKASTRSGRAMLRLVNLLQTLQPVSMGNAMRLIRSGRRFIEGAQVIKTGYGAYQNFGHEFAEQFAEMTSDAIAARIDSELNPIEALHIKKMWAVQQLEEMKTARNWAIADTTLAVVGLADPTGVVDLVAAYTKPTCTDVIPFPTFSANQAPQAICHQNTVLIADASCRAAPDPVVDLDDGSFDPEGSLLQRLILDPGPYGIGDSIVTLEVVDNEGKPAYCDTLLTVTDTTPPNVECTEKKTVDNDPGQCGAVVSYNTPVGEDNCDSQTVQTGGLSSGSVFEVGVTTNSFKVTDTAGQEASCEFCITVVDVEPPTISCSHLAITKPTDPGVCTAMYYYSLPVADDNCGAATNQYECPDVGFDPCLFPVGTTTNSFQATDSYGNYATCSFDVTIEDMEDPVIVCPADVTRFCGDVDPSSTGFATASDNCDVESVTYSDHVSIAAGGDVGHCDKVTLRTWTATDAAQNTVECTQLIEENANFTRPDPGMMGDPHLMSWTGEFFDYMGECDLKLLHVSNFDGSQHDLTVHVRTTVRYDYSFIEAAAIRIGEDTLSVSSWGEYTLNGVEDALINSLATTRFGKANAVPKIGGYPIFHTHVNDKNHRFDIVLPQHQNLTISTMKDIVNVKVHQPLEHYFGNVEGFLGDFSGRMLARDGMMNLHDDINGMADEWQLTSTDPVLFETVRAPQYPEKCRMPNITTTSESRRLGEGITEEEATTACAHLKGNAPALAACIYDVTATNDLDQALAYSSYSGSK